MHSSLLQLEDYGLTDIAIKWEPSNQDAAEEAAAIAINYQVARQIEAPRRYKLTLQFRHAAGSADGRNRLAIQASLVGFFLFPEEMPVPEREKAIRVNGLTILYGALRGLLLPITAAFPPGFRYVLPAVDMLQVIKTEEEQRRTVAVARVKTSSYRPTREKKPAGPSSKTVKP